MSFESEPREEQKESIERKKERLQPVFAESLEVYRNPDRPLIEGALTVTRENEGKIETFQGLVTLEINEDAIALGGIEEDGEIGFSAWMEWDELIDAEKAEIPEARED